MSRNDTAKFPNDAPWKPVGAGLLVSRKCAACNHPSSTTGGGSYPVKGSRAIWHCPSCTKAARGDTNRPKPSAAKLTVCPGYTGDPRIQADPAHVGIFTLAGIGRDAETGKPWEPLA